MGQDCSRYRKRYVDLLAGYSAYTGPIMRTGLGFVLLLAGAHKLVAPAVWTKYAAPWVTGIWPEWILGFELFMILNGAIEIAFGIALIANFYTTILAGITALSLLSVVINLGTGGLMTGEHVDVLIRDLGLTVLAVGVTLVSARRSSTSVEP